MNKQTKLVDCGSAVFIYDYSYSKRIANLKFETESILGELTKIERMLLTNFVDEERMFITFTLEINVEKNNGVHGKIQKFIKQLKELSIRKSLKYFALLELPADVNGYKQRLHMATDLELHEIAPPLDEICDDDLSDDSALISSLWGANVSIDLYLSEIVDVFQSAYKRSNRSKLLEMYPKLNFHSRLNKPVILYNLQADKYIEQNEILSYPDHEVGHLRDNLIGEITVNKYYKFENDYLGSWEDSPWSAEESCNIYSSFDV